MDKPVIKLIVPGEKYNLEIYESEPGILTLCMNENDENGQGGGWIEADTQDFMEKLNKLLSK